MIPTELLTLGASTLAGGTMRLIGMWAEAKREQAQATMQLLGERTNNAVRLSSAGTPGYQWTRRTIALMVIFAVMVLPKLAVLILPDLPVVYGWTSSPSGLASWLFGMEQLTWHVTRGLVITPLDTNFAMAIAGLYFGSASVSIRR